MTKILQNWGYFLKILGKKIGDSLMKSGALLRCHWMLDFSWFWQATDRNLSRNFIENRSRRTISNQET